jgi:hypothetical protein
MLSSDGCINVAVIDDPSCCPPPLCGNDLCCTFVAFFNLLPSGPLWDYWKAQAISYFQSNDNPAECPLLQDPRCPSMVLHAIYTVLKLRHMVHHALWPAFRESNPNTAVTTLDYHLDRLNWENCYASHCRAATLGVLSPIEVMGECGPIYCEPNYPPELEVALKRAIAVSLTRANMGVIKNLCGLNWIIDPLGAVLVPIYYVPPAGCVDPPDDGVIWPDQDVPCIEVPEEECAGDPCDPDSACVGMAFELCPSRSYLDGVGTGDVCDTLAPPPQVPAWFDWGCLDDRPAGVPDRVWPGVLAAECIVRSLVPYLTCQNPVTLYQCCPEVMPA